MNAPLYTTEVLRLAASLPEPRVLERVDGTADERSPTCGSRVRVEVQMNEAGRIEVVSQRIEACAFGQAAASLLDAAAPARSREEVASALGQLAAWLSGERDDPGLWPGLQALAPARPRKSRHGAILLPFRALVTAMERSS
jgi:NifU-like protein involved in Fe-S cluster formation